MLTNAAIPFYHHIQRWKHESDHTLLTLFRKGCRIPKRKGHTYIPAMTVRSIHTIDTLMMMIFFFLSSNFLLNSGDKAGYFPATRSRLK